MTIENNTRWPAPNHNFVPEYQQSGIPHAEAIELDANGVHQFTFTHVTRWISISSSAACYVNFNDDPDSFNDTKSFYIPANTATRFEVKCKSVNVKATAENQFIHVLAGLTGIPARNFPDQTSDNGFFV